MTKRQYVNCRIPALSLVLILLLSLFCTVVSAATPEEIKAQNQALQIEKYVALGDIENENISSEVGRNANSLLSIYKNKLNLIGDTELELEQTRITINLIYEQGVAINDVAWIYFTHADSLDSDGKEAVDASFEALKAEILNATDPTALKQKNTAHFDNLGLCARMHVSIYSEKLDDLLKEGDSDKVIAKVEAAKLEITKCADTSLTSPEYEAILAKAKFAVELQRAQDEGLGELEAIFTALYGKDALKSNEIYTKAIADVDADSCDTKEKINSILLSATNTATLSLEENGGSYVKEFYSNF